MRGSVDHLGRAAEEAELDAADPNAELARDERVTELVEQHGCERETHDHHAGDAAERDEHEPEEHQEAEVDLDRETEQGPQSPLLEHVVPTCALSTSRMQVALPALLDQLADPASELLAILAGNPGNGQTRARSVPCRSMNRM